MTKMTNTSNDFVRKFNKHVLNPVMLHLAGRSIGTRRQSNTSVDVRADRMPPR
jgi:hypothetical protein